MTKFILLIICIIEAFIIGFMYTSKEEISNNDEIFILEYVKDSIIRDSIFIIDRQIKTKIIHVEKNFQKDSSAIMSADDSTLLSNFSRYIEDYRKSGTNTNR